MTTTDTNDKAAAVAQPGAPATPHTPSPKKHAEPKNGAPQRLTAGKSKTRIAPPAKQAKTSKKAVKQTRAAKATAPRAESKSATILDLIRRAKGATLTEIMKATEWQAHSVRSFLSVAAKKHQLKIESAKNQAGDRVYRVSK